MVVLPAGENFVVCCGGAMAANFFVISSVIADKLFPESFSLADTQADLLRTFIILGLGFAVGCIIGSKYIKKMENLKEENHTLYLVMGFLEIPFALLLNVPWILAFKLSGTF